MPTSGRRGRSGLVGAVEGGGTKFRAALVDDRMRVRDSVRVPTSDPENTLGAVAEFFRSSEPIDALGIACFGPLDLDEASESHGCLSDTPKPGWTGTAVLARLRADTGVQAAIQTDVEAAAVSEQALGPQPPPSSLAYVTVGTGIGAAVAVDGTPQRGRRHSELGHIPVRRAADDDYAGCCPFHGDCLEGMACGAALADRRARAEGCGAESPEERLWDLEARYLAQLVRVLAYSYAPDRIVFGGGVGARAGLVERVREHALVELGGYADDISRHAGTVTSPALGEDSGLLGAAVLAHSLSRSGPFSHR